MIFFDDYSFSLIIVKTTDFHFTFDDINDKLPHRVEKTFSKKMNEG
jgi:hypothetical protein